MPAGKLPLDEDAALDQTLTATTGEQPAANAADVTLAGAHERYQIVEEVARGGSGRILSAHDERLDRRVAVKTPLTADPKMRERFKREAALAARLQHPAIIPVYDLGQWSSGDPYYVTKLLDSRRTLKQLIAESGDIDARLALLPHVITVADAIAYAHSVGVIHRDLKPSNILIGPFGETVVIDWGLAKTLGDGDDDQNVVENHGGDDPHADITAVGAVIGTPQYMPPEQAAGERVDRTADVYSLGAILYHVLAGEPAYIGESAERVLANVLQTSPPSIAKVAPALPPELVSIVETSMQRDRALRYPSAVELAAALKAFQTSRLVLDPQARRGAHERLERALVREDRHALDSDAAMHRMFFELRRDVKTKLAEALESAGHGPEAAEAYLAASIGAGATEALELQRRAGEQLLRSGRVNEGLVALRFVLELAGMKMPRTQRTALLALIAARVRLWWRGTRFRERAEPSVDEFELSRVDACWSVAHGLLMIDVVRGLGFATRHLLLALALGEPKRIARSLAVDAMHLASAGASPRRCERRLEQARQLADRVGDAQAKALTHWSAGVSAYCRGRWREGYERSSTAIQIFRDDCRNVAWELASARDFALWCQFYLGEIASIVESVPILLAEAQQRGDRYSMMNLRTSHTSIAWLARDDAAGGLRAIEDARREWSAKGHHFQDYYELYALVQNALYRGDAAGLWRLVESRLPAIERSGLLRIQLVRVEVASLRARAALLAADEAGADRERLMDAATRAADRIERERAAWATPIAAVVRAGVASRRQRPADAVRLWEAAGNAFRAADMTLFAAAASYRAGTAAGDPTGAAAVVAARECMSAQGIARPERMAAVFAP